MMNTSPDIVDIGRNILVTGEYVLLGLRRGDRLRAFWASGGLARVAMPGSLLFHFLGNLSYASIIL